MLLQRIFVVLHPLEHFQVRIEQTFLKVYLINQPLLAFIAFEFSLVLAPICLLIFVLPIMIGPNYRSWGLDVIKAWWERKDWSGDFLFY